MSRGLLRWVVTMPNAALGEAAVPGCRTMPDPTCGGLQAVRASARTWIFFVSPILKFFVSDKLATEYGWLRRLSRVVGTFRRPNAVRLTKPGASNAERSIPNLAPWPSPSPSRLLIDVTTPAQHNFYQLTEQYLCGKTNLFD